MTLLNENNQVSHFEKGSVIFLENTPSSFLYIISSGRVRIVKESGDRIIPLAIVKEKEFIGELSIFDDSKHNATAIAHGPVDLVKVQKSDIQNQLNSLPDWINTIMLTLTDRLRSIDDIIQKNRIIDDDLCEGIPLLPEEEVLIKAKIAEAKKAYAR